MKEHTDSPGDNSAIPISIEMAADAPSPHVVIYAISFVIQRHMIKKVNTQL